MEILKKTIEKFLLFFLLIYLFIKYNLNKKKNLFKLYKLEKSK
jgi:hypothetical protein